MDQKEKEEILKKVKEKLKHLSKEDKKLLEILLKEELKKRKDNVKA